MRIERNASGYRAFAPPRVVPATRFLAGRCAEGNAFGACRHATQNRRPLRIYAARFGCCAGQSTDRSQTTIASPRSALTNQVWCSAQTRSASTLATATTGSGEARGTWRRTFVGRRAHQWPAPEGHRRPRNVAYVLRARGGATTGSGQQWRWQLAVAQASQLFLSRGNQCVVEPADQVTPRCLPVFD